MGCRSGAGGLTYQIDDGVHSAIIKAWVVMFGRSAKLPPGQFPRSGTMPSHLNRAKEYPVGSMYIHGTEGLAFYANQIHWPAEGMGATAVLGRGPDMGLTFFDIAIPASEPLVKDLGEHVVVTTPTLGRWNGQYNRGPEPLKPLEEGVDPKIAKLLEAHRWFEPRRLEASFQADWDGALQQSGTPSVEPYFSLEGVLVG